MQQSQSRIPFVESQFYARSSNIPYSKLYDFNGKKADEFHSSSPINDVFHDAIDDLNRNKDQVMNSKGKKFTFTTWK